MDKCSNCLEKKEHKLFCIVCNTEKKKGEDRCPKCTSNCWVCKECKK